VRPDYDGSTLIDSAGDELGTIRQTYVDEDGFARFFDVKMGSVFTRHHLVPADQAQFTPDGVRVPFLRDVVEESPSFDPEDTLEGDTLSQARNYYSQRFGATAALLDGTVSSVQTG